MANDYVRQVADTLIRQLERGTAPWQKPWEPGERFMPYNPVTGKGYHGINALYLMATMDGRGVADPRWMTFKQAQSVNAYVRKGEKSTPIQFWKWHDTVPVLDEAGKPKRDENGQPMRATVLLEKPRVFSASVFNASQIEGLPPQERAAPPEWDRHQRAEAIIAHSGAAIQHTAGNRAFYTLRHDSITMPERGQFPTADRYYATLLHEMGHWTGHESRLNRDLSHPFGSEGYAREELRAEIASLMLNEQLAIGHDPGQHAAYVDSWIKVLTNDPREIFRAASDAEKISRMLIGFEMQQAQTSEQTAMQDAASSSTTMQMPEDAAPPKPATVSQERTYIAVPYAEKDDAKEFGAKWDRGAKSWYVPAGVDLNAFTAWMPNAASVHIEVDADPREQFAEAIRECGLILNQPPEMDGQIHRIQAVGDNGHERSGAYKGYVDGRPAGYIQNFRTGFKTNWRANSPAQILSAKDRAHLAAETAQKRQERAQEREKQAEHAAQQADALWSAAKPAETHPYLEAKGIQAHGARLDERDNLLVPLMGADGQICSLQRIRPDGFKQFMEGGRVEGGHYVIGDTSQPGPVLIAEGFATAATLHEISQRPVIVAFNAGNLLPVAAAYRHLHPETAIVIAGDDDRHVGDERDAQGRLKPNVGREKAEEAAEQIGAQAVFPPFEDDERGTDWNDYAKKWGTERTSLLLQHGIVIAEALHGAKDVATNTASRESRSENQQEHQAENDVCLDGGMDLTP